MEDKFEKSQSDQITNRKLNDCALDVFDKHCTVDQKAGPFLPRRNLVTLYESDRKKCCLFENLTK